MKSLKELEQELDELDGKPEEFLFQFGYVTAALGICALALELYLILKR